MLNKFFTTINCLNQAIQPRVVGPLFIKGCIVYIVAKLIGIGCGTSIDIINIRGPWRVSAMARKVGSSLVEPCTLPHSCWRNQLRCLYVIIL